MIKITTPLRWEEDDRSGSVTLIAADGAVIISDNSREVMPEWLDEIARAVNAHEALVAAIQKQIELWEMATPALDLADARQHQVKFTEFHNPIGLLRAALAKAGMPC